MVAEITWNRIVSLNLLTLLKGCLLWVVASVLQHRGGMSINLPCSNTNLFVQFLGSDLDKQIGQIGISIHLGAWKSWFSLLQQIIWFVVSFGESPWLWTHIDIKDLGVSAPGETHMRGGCQVANNDHQPSTALWLLSLKVAQSKWLYVTVTAPNQHVNQTNTSTTASNDLPTWILHASVSINHPGSTDQRSSQASWSLYNSNSQHGTANEHGLRFWTAGVCYWG